MRNSLFSFDFKLIFWPGENLDRFCGSRVLMALIQMHANVQTIKARLKRR
uniref:Uncharacterized protein n=1 Tax=Anguilla anguilla TaxID=7936 RepID=A0A0E9SZM6_ANGAN